MAEPGTGPAVSSAEYVQQQRRWPVVVVVLALLVVAALAAALVLQRSASTAGGPPVATDGELPTIPPAAPGEQEGFALAGADGAVVYLQSARAVQRADLGSGATTLTATPEVAGVSTLVAGSGWVVSKSLDSPSGVLVRDGGGAQLLPVALQQASRVYAAGPDVVWSIGTTPVQGVRTAVQLDVNGARVGTTSIRVPAELGVPTGHLTDALLATNAQGTYVAGPDGVRRVSRGVLLAVGSDAVMTWDCDAAQRCDARVNRGKAAPQYLPGARVSLRGLYGKDLASAAGHVGVLSPDRRWAALQLPRPTRSGSSLVLVDLRTGHRVEVPGALTRVNGNDQAAWTPNGRYLLALTGGRLRAFDATTEKVVTLAGTPADLTHLTIAGTATL